MIMDFLIVQRNIFLPTMNQSNIYLRDVRRYERAKNVGEEYFQKRSISFYSSGGEERRNFHDIVIKKKSLSCRLRLL